MKRLFTDDFCELTEEEKEYLKEEIRDMNDFDDEEDIDDEDIYDRFMFDLEYDGEDLEYILDHVDSELDNNELICTASLGLWTGRVSAYKELDRLKDIRSCMEDYNTIYVERNDLKVKAVHHDGTNYYTIRQFKDISERQKENFLDKIYNGTATAKDVTRYTKGIGKIALENWCM